MIPIEYIAALCWAIVWGIFAIGFRINGKINTAGLLVILGFALIGGVAIANIEYLTKLSTGNIGAEFKDEMNTYKNTLIEEIKTEADTQKDSIKLLTKTAIQVIDILQDTLEQVSRHEESIISLIESANKAEEKLQLAIEMEKPPALEFTNQRTTQVNDGYVSTIGFMPTEDKPLGQVKLSIEVMDSIEAQINRFFPSGMVGNPTSETTEDGKKASLQYSPPNQGLQEVIVQVSDTCNLLFTGNYISEPILVTIPGDKY